MYVHCNTVYSSELYFKNPAKRRYVTSVSLFIPYPISQIPYPISHIPYSHTPIFPYSHTPIIPYSHTPILPYSHTPILSYSHTPILPYSHNLILPYSHTPILPYFQARDPSDPLFSNTELDLHTCIKLGLLNGCSL